MSDAIVEIAFCGVVSPFFTYSLTPFYCALLCYIIIVKLEKQIIRYELGQKVLHNCKRTSSGDRRWVLLLWAPAENRSGICKGSLHLQHFPLTYLLFYDFPISVCLIHPPFTSEAAKMFDSERMRLASENFFAYFVLCTFLLIIFLIQ